MTLPLPPHTTAAVARGATQVRVFVEVPKMAASRLEGRKTVQCGTMLFDLSRATVDRGFPTSDDGALLPVTRWSGGSDPAPESCYRYGYLHVPFTHPDDGWEENTDDDARWRVYCPWGPGQVVTVPERVWVDRKVCRGVGVQCLRAFYDDGTMRFEDGSRPDGPAIPTCIEGWTPAQRAEYMDLNSSVQRFEPADAPEWTIRHRYTITRVRPQRLGEVTKHDAHLEGYGCFDCGSRGWVYGPGCNAFTEYNKTYEQCGACAKAAQAAGVHWRPMDQTASTGEWVAINPLKAMIAAHEEANGPGSFERDRERWCWVLGVEVRK